MKKTLLLSLGFIVLSNFNIAAQPRDYFKLIYEAEESLIEDNFSEACIHYANAFKVSNDIIFLKDVHNALMCANHSKDSVRFKEFAIHFMRFDVDKEFTESYSAKLENSYFSILSDVPPTFTTMSEVCDFLKRMKTVDQSLRIKCGEDKNCFLCRTEIGKLDSINAKTVIEYVKIHGYPNDLSRCKHNPTLTSAIDLVVLHNTQAGNHTNHKLLIDSVFPVLKQEVLKGNLHPQIFASRVDQLMDSGKIGPHIYGARSCLKIEDRMFLFPIASEEQLKKVNEERQGIYLDSFEESQKKFAYQKFNPEFYLIYPAFMTVLDIRGEQKAAMIEQIKIFEVLRPQKK